MTPQSANRAALLVFADRLESEARALPQWHPETSESWSEFLERQYQAELALAQKLQALPDCQLIMCSAHLQVQLVLHGIRTRTKQGLAHACQLWAEKVRARLEPLQSVIFAVLTTGLMTV